MLFLNEHILVQFWVKRKGKKGCAPLSSCYKSRTTMMKSDRASGLTYINMISQWKVLHLQQQFNKHNLMKTLRDKSEMNGSQLLTRNRLLQLTPKIKQRQYSYKRALTGHRAQTTSQIHNLMFDDTKFHHEGTSQHGKALMLGHERSDLPLSNVTYF